MLNGYIVYKKTLSKQEQEFALSSIEGDKVDYSLLKIFIDNYFLPKIPFKDPIYLKARISNNNNSDDASLLHSDLYNFTNEKEIPMYTALCYFDKAQLELIPRSHTKPHDSFIKEYSRTIVIDLDPGDIVVFNSVIVHRGVNYSKNNRRVLQVFEIFPTSQLYKENISKMLTVDTSNKNTKKILSYVAQIKWLVDIVNCIVFFLGYYNLKYKVMGKDLPPWRKNGKYISYEPGGRVNYKEGLIDDINKNIIFHDSEIVKSSYFYTWIILIILIFVFTVILIR